MLRRKPTAPVIDPIPPVLGCRFIVGSKVYNFSATLAIACTWVTRPQRPYDTYACDTLAELMQIYCVNYMYLLCQKKAQCLVDDCCFVVMVVKFDTSWLVGMTETSSMCSVYNHLCRSPIMHPARQGHELGSVHCYMNIVMWHYAHTKYGSLFKLLSIGLLWLCKWDPTFISSIYVLITKSQ